VPDRFLTAADLGHAGQGAAHQTVLLDSATREPFLPGGTLAAHFSEAGQGRWNLDLGGRDPVLTLYGTHEDAVAVDLPRFDAGETEGGSIIRRGVPVMRIGEKLVTTVFDLLMAQYAVGRDGLPGQWPASYDDPQPYTPAWQEGITSVPAAAAARVAREFARNAELSRGRSMIAMGAGTNHWFHSDQIYRTFLTLTMLCGCQGVNGGGWAHYVGQEKVRPLTGFQTLAFGLDWQRPTRHMTGTSFFYLHSDQWRYESFGAGELASPLGHGLFTGRVRRCAGPGIADGLDTVAPGVRPQPARPGRRGGRRGQAGERLRRGRADGRPAAFRRRGPRRPAQLPARDDDLAGQPARLLRQGHGVLHAAPARRRGRGAGRRVAGATAAEGGDLAGTGAAASSTWSRPSTSG